MRSANIKNYCIALEALSRIPGSNSERIGNRIRDLLHHELLQSETGRPEMKPSASGTDDEIPF